jgi:NTP pyrophosphatase (non-canonical NTP hydrolase)
MQELKEKPTLSDLQQYMAEFCKERSWDKDTYTEKFLLFTEEVGELAKAMRKATGMYSEEARKHKRFDLEEEFADVLNYLLDMANLFEVDLESAFREKDKLNRERSW